MKIIQLTDLHLVPEGQKIHEIDPSQRFEQALANIKLRHPDLDLLVITGDLCNEGDTPSYRLLRELLEKYELNYQLVLGNHDQRGPPYIPARIEQHLPAIHASVIEAAA